MNVEDIKKDIEQNKLSNKDVNELLLEVSWIEYPDLIRKLLAYRSEPEKAAATVKTDEDVKNEWRIEKLPNGTLKLVAYKGNDEIVQIPDTIGKAKVTELGDFVLSLNQPGIKKEMKEARARIKSVIIGDSVKKIGVSAFESCENLESISLPKKIKELPENCFTGCINLKRFVIPETVKKIGIGVFSNCKALETVGISSSMVEIPPHTFEECTKLKNIEWGTNINKIGYAAFRRCESLTEIIIPEGVTNFSGERYYSVNAETFLGCKRLKKVVLPETVTKINGWAFEYCESLVDINIPKKLTSIGCCAFRGCKKLSDLIIPETVTKIDSSFSECKKLTLHVKSDSYAAKYAEKRKINYIEE